MKTTKRLVSLVLCFLMIAAIGVPAFAETKGSTPYAGYVVGNNVNLRNGPDVWSTILGQVNNGDTFLVYGVEGNWVHVHMTSGQTAPPYPNSDGYIYINYTHLYYG